MKNKRNLLVLFLLLLSLPFQSPELSYAQGTKTWEETFAWQLQVWEQRYPNQSISFVVVRGGVSNGVDSCVQMAAELSTLWQRPVIVLPTLPMPNTKLDDIMQAASNRMSPGSVPDQGVQILETILNQGHTIAEVHFFSHAGIVLNNEVPDYVNFLNEHPDSGITKIVGFGTYLQPNTIVELKGAGVQVENIGKDYVYQLTKLDPPNTFTSAVILPVMILPTLNSTVVSLALGPAHDLINYEKIYGVESGLQKTPSASGEVTLQPPPEELIAASNNKTIILPPNPPDNGGVDFSTLKIRYLSENPGEDYSFGAVLSGEPTIGEASSPEAEGDSLAWDSLYIWLALPSDTFWVNLNPNEPDRVADVEMGKTDVGRIMLEADFEMKKTVAKLFHPDSELGQVFWDKVYAYIEERGASTVCFSFRQWIVPGEVIAWSTQDSIYIKDAKLDIKLESEYLEIAGRDPAGMGCGPNADPAVQDYMEEQFRQMILPELINEVNTAPEYNDLRRIFNSRVIAEWYKGQHATGRETAFSKYINSGDVSDWYMKTAWDKQDVFDAYVKSVTEGEFNLERETQNGNTIITRTYFYGGVDLAEMPIEEIPYDSLLAEHPQVEQEVINAMFNPAGYWTDSEVFVGGSFQSNQSGSGGPDGGGNNDGDGDGDGDGDEGGDETATPDPTRRIIATATAAEIANVPTLIPTNGSEVRVTSEDPSSGTPGRSPIIFVAAIFGAVGLVAIIVLVRAKKPQVPPDPPDFWS